MSNLKIKAKEINSKLGVELKAIRTEQRFTMRALAEIIETPHSFIGKTEQLNRRLDVGEFIYYCEALEADPATVIKKLVAQTKTSTKAKTK